MRTPVVSALAALLFVALQPASADQPFALKSNDVVVFYGDSITDQRMYSMLTELFVVTRYPKLNVNFIHSGWGGDRVTGGGGGNIDLRLTRDVEAYQPTAVTIMLGMNDGKYANHSSDDDTTYYNGYRHIIDSLKKYNPDLRITVIGPSPFDDITRPFTLQPSGYNTVLVHYSEFLKKYAEDSKLSFADLNTGVVDMLKQANGSNPALAQKIIPDRVHPGWAGHLIMAEQLLKAWNARPVVSAVTIDAASARVQEMQYASVSDVHASAHIEWTETDEALPLPFANLIAADNDKTIALAIQSSDITQALNQQPLKIIGLTDAKYSLSIDDQPIGVFTSRELSRGINLAALNTPMSKQAMNVRDLTIKRLDVHQQRWRTLQVPLSSLAPDHLEAALKDLDALDQELAQKQRGAAQPLPHHFSLVVSPQ